MTFPSTIVKSGLTGMVGLSVALSSAPVFADDSLETVVVTASRVPQPQRLAAVRTDVLSDSVIRGSGARSLADAIALVPLARSENNCQNCNSTEIQLLGLPGAYNQILFDGIPLFSGVASVYGVEQIPAPLVEQIEVLKGGASALYGPGAVAGVINVISKKPTQNAAGFYANHEFRSGEPMQSLGGYGALVSDDQRATLQVFAQVEDQEPRDYNGDGFTELVDREQTTGGFLSRYQFSDDTALALNYQYTDSSRRGGNRFDQPSQLANLSEEIDTEFHRASITFTHSLSDATQIEASYGYAQIDRDTFYGGLGDVQADASAADFDAAAFAEALATSRNQFGTTEDKLHYAELRSLTSFDAHDLSFAVQYRQESVTDINQTLEGEFLNTLVDNKFDNTGLLVQDEWTLSDSTRLLLGLRADWSSEIDDPIISPRVGLWFGPTPEWVIRANISTGFRAPEVFNEDIHIETLAAQPIRVINDDNLKEETATSYALGFDFDPAWRDNLLGLDGQVYYTDLKDTFFLGDIQEDAAGQLFQRRTNVGGSKVFGAELTATLRPSQHLQLSLGTAYVDASYDDSEVIFEDGGLVVATDRYLKTPRVTGIFQAIWSAPGGIDAFVAVRHTGPMLVLNNNTGFLKKTRSYTEVDLTATKHLDKLFGDWHVDVTVGVKNLLDDFQTDQDLGVERDAEFIYGPRLPRTAFISLTADL